MEGIKQPFTNVQLELLKVFSRNVNDEDLKDLKELLANFFAERLVKQANKVWDEKGWTDADVDRILNTANRFSKSRSY